MYPINIIEINKRKEREKKTMKIYDEDTIEIKMWATVGGLPYFLIEDNYMRILLYSNELEKCHELTKEEEIQLMKLINWINNKDILEWMDSNKFRMSDLRFYIRVKASKDNDFLRFWRYYNFDILINLFNNMKLLN